MAMRSVAQDDSSGSVYNTLYFFFRFVGKAWAGWEILLDLGTYKGYCLDLSVQ
jgi:hypothetical protein